VGLIEDSTHSAHPTKGHAWPEDAAEEERRIRRGMRLDAKLWAKKKPRNVPKMLGRATLVVTGVFLGWAGSRFWRE